jgi:uncharacterized membrane protein YciS (DUF1049 family)
MADDDEGSSSPTEKKDRARLVGAVVLVGVILALGLDNARQVKIGYVIGDAHVRLVYLLLITAVLGFGVGYLTRGRRKRS